MITSETQATPPPAATPAAQTTAVHAHEFSFHDFLSAINPLQYLPVVGTIYRAVTGDVIPEALREGGSLLVSGLMGGPIGLVTSIAETIAEKVTGIDPEKIVTAMFHGPSPAVAAPATPPPVDPVVASAPAVTSAPAAPRVAMTPEQLAAYGVRPDASGASKLDDAGGADLLNGIELVRLGQASAAYAANQATPPAVKGS
jgi:hypothetical protein